MRENRTPLNSSPARPAPRIAWWRRLAAWPIAKLLRLWHATLRIEISPDSVRAVSQTGRPVIFALWHNRLFITPEMVRRYRQGRRLYALVSASRDGGWLTAIFNALNMEAVRGSSSRRGREAATDAIEILAAGHDLGITPDGPRGPAYTAKPGIIVMARRTNAVLVLMHIEFLSSWRLSSWDGFHLPKPFSTIRLTIEEAPVDATDDTEEAARRIEARLNAMTNDRYPIRPRKPA